MDDLKGLRKVIGKTFRKAKGCYLAYFVCQIAILVFAVISMFVQPSPYLIASIAFLGVLATEYLRWRSDYWRSQGESAKRKWEMADGLGIAPDSKGITDWLASRPEGFLSDVTSEETQGSDFDSVLPKGPLRLVENTQESAWWSKCESQRMVSYLAIAVVAAIGVPIVAVAISIGALDVAKVEQSGALVQNLAAVACYMLAFVLSINLVRLLVDFSTFRSELDDILRRCDEALKSPNLGERDAIFIMHDYHIARSSAPLLPTFIWRLHGKHLREQWGQRAQFRSESKCRKIRKNQRGKHLP